MKGGLVARQPGEALGWCFLHLLGHNRVAGYVSEASIAGAPFLRVDGPGENGPTQFFSPQAVYAITPTTARMAKACQDLRYAPVHEWEIPKPKRHRERCEGCESVRVFTHDTDGIPLCKTCYDELAAEQGNVPVDAGEVAPAAAPEAPPTGSDPEPLLTCKRCSGQFHYPSEMEWFGCETYCKPCYGKVSSEASKEPCDSGKEPCEAPSSPSASYDEDYYPF